MKLICLFVQRKCDYEGEFAPELFAAIDEIGNDENPDYLDSQEQTAKEDLTINFYKRIIIEISDEKFNKLFFDAPIIEGKIVKD